MSCCATYVGALTQHTSVVTDGALCDVARVAPRLQRLALIGCKQVHGAGVHALVTDALTDLSLESMALDRGVLAALAPRLAQLQSLTLTYPGRESDVPWFFDELSLVLDACTSLRQLVLYARGGSARIEDEDVDAHASPAMSPVFWERLTRSPSAASLRVLRIHGIGVSVAQLAQLGHSPVAAGLEELVVHVAETSISALPPHLRRFPALRSLHVLVHWHDAAGHADEVAAALLHYSGPWLQQLGVGHRVWLVHMADERTLQPWDKAAGLFPSSMLVVRS